MTAVFPSVNIIISGALPNIQSRYNRSVIANKQDCHQHKPAIYRPLELSTNLREVCLKDQLRHYAKQGLQSGKYIDVKMEESVLTNPSVCCDLCGQVFPQFHNNVFKSSLNARFGHSETSRMFIDSSNHDDGYDDDGNDAAGQVLPDLGAAPGVRVRVPGAGEL